MIIKLNYLQATTYESTLHMKGEELSTLGTSIDSRVLFRLIRSATRRRKVLPRLSVTESKPLSRPASTSCSIPLYWHSLMARNRRRAKASTSDTIVELLSTDDVTLKLMLIDKF